MTGAELCRPSQYIQCTALRGSAMVFPMPTSAVQPAKAKTFTKREVIDFLGKSKRTVEIYISDGRLPCQYFNGPNGRTAVFERAAVERLKADLDTPMVRALVAPGDVSRKDAKFTTGSLDDTDGAGNALALLQKPDLANVFASALASFARNTSAPVVKPWLTLQEAVDYSGLPAPYLVRAARKGTIRAVGRGKDRRYNREALAK